MSTIKDIIDALNEINKSSAYKVFIPSLNKEISFKQLTTEQLKVLYTTTANPSYTNFEFNIKINEIIKTNCLDKDINIDNLTVYDKILFFLKTKIECISPEFRFNLTSKEIKNNNIQTDFVLFSIAEHFNNVNKTELPELTKEIIYDNFKIICNIPTLKTENKIDDALLSIAFDTDDVSVIVSSTFIGEIAKYIKRVIIKDQIIEFNALSFAESSNIIESIPAFVMKDALTFIEESKKTINKLLTCKVKIDNDIVLDKEIPFNGLFFNI